MSALVKTIEWSCVSRRHAFHSIFMFVDIFRDSLSLKIFDTPKVLIIYLKKRGCLYMNKYHSILKKLCNREFGLVVLDWFCLG